jgi:hypothetical protein
MALPDDILPDDELPPDEEAADGGDAPEVENPPEKDTLQDQFNSMAEATQKEFDKNNPAPKPATETYVRRTDPYRTERIEPLPSKSAPAERDHWQEMRKRGEEESGKAAPEDKRRRRRQPPLPTSEPPETLQDYVDQGGQIPDFSADQDSDGDDKKSWLDADLKFKSLVTSGLIDHTQQINMLIRRLELGGL